MTIDSLQTKSSSITNAVFLLVIVGFLLRVSCILWGVPLLPQMGRYHPDEYSSYRHVLEFPGNYLKETNYVYGTAVPYMLAVIMLPLKAILTPSQWDLACLLGMRLVSTFAGSASIILVYRLTRSLYSDRTALLAAGFTVVSFTHCMNSVFATQDIIMGAMILICFLTLFHASEHGQLNDFIASGAFLGILACTKLVGLIFFGVLPLIAIADITSAGQERARRLRLWLGWTTVCCLSAFTVFALASPSILINLSDFLEFWKAQKIGWYDRLMVPWYEVPWIWWRMSAIAVGAPVVIAFFVGALLPKARYRSQHVAILGFIFLYYLLNRHHVLPRYVASIAPLLCIYGARACALGIESRARWLRFSGYGAAAIILGFSVWGCGAGVYARFSDPRTQAARWLKTHAPPGSTIGVAETSPPTIQDWENPALDDLSLRLVSVDMRPELIIMSSRSYDMMNEALRSPYLKNWSWDPQHNGFWYNYIPPRPETFRLFDELLLRPDGEYRLESDFEVPSSGFEIDFMVGTRIYRRVIRNSSSQ